MALKRTQVIIVGAGMVGLALACALARRDRSVVVVERGQEKRDIPSQPTLRVSALNHAAQNWLSELGAWQRIPQDRICLYQGMQVWDSESRGKIDFSAAQADLPHLGGIVENAVVEAALWQQAEAEGVDFVTEAECGVPEFHEQDVSVEIEGGKHNGDVVLGQLLIAADGGNSTLRQQAGMPVTFRDYQQHGLVCTIETEFAHEHIARQAFLPGGPLALLPMADQNHCSIVWSLPVEEALRWKEQPADALAKALTAASDSALGKVKVHEPVASFPLRMQYAERWLHERLILVGDAAHTIHPLAGQGANLGLGDAHLLAQELNTAGTVNGQWNWQRLQRRLRHYERARKTAATRHILTMEGFHQLFTEQPLPVKLLRGIGLSATNRAEPLKRFFLKQANQF